MRRIIIMSGPAKLRMLAIIGVISVFYLVIGKLFFTLFNQFFRFIFPECDVRRRLGR